MKTWLLGIVVSLALSIQAQVPEMFRYQGRLVDETTLVNATLPMSFKLFNAETGGSLLYEDSSSVLVVDGLYSTYIGDNTISGNLTDALKNPSVFLELTIDGETLTPRERLVSVPYALNTQADPTPTGTIVLSGTSPNTDLESQGYSPYYEDVTQADWAEVILKKIPLNGYSFNLFSWNEKLGIYHDEMNKNIAVTEGGKNWVTGNHPLQYAMHLHTAQLNNRLYLFEENHLNRAASTADLSSWNTWTNYFSTDHMLSYTVDELVEFKDSLWAFTANYPSNFVMQSSDGSNWTQTAIGNWGDLNMHGDVLSSDDTMYVVAAESGSSMSNKVWSTTDGTNWHTSLSSIPSGDTGITVIEHDGALWNFTQDSASTGTCWRSTNHGDSWTKVSSSIPNYRIHSNYEVISHAGKFWLWGAGEEMNIVKVFWSDNAIDWTESLNVYSESPDYTQLIGTPDGRLWFYPGARTYNLYQSLYFIGGPKKEDGLYYYQKD